jgi:regulator of sirC expression with transglutaminase-like and TPR domain
MSARSRKTFQQLVTLPDGAIPLAEAALLMACEEYPQLEIRPYIESLDAMAETVRREIRGRDGPIETIGRINDVLFGVLGFRGNTERYFDPRNSFFNDVLDRRMGIPITLGTLYMEIGRRLEIPIVGIGMPGHFLVKYADRNSEFFLDPFNAGGILSREACLGRLKEFFGGAVEFQDRLLARVTHKEILRRMLNNLKAIYFKAQSFGRGLAMVEMLLMISPDDAEQYRDRGLVHLRRREFHGASKDLRRYLEMAPNAPDRREIEEHCRATRRYQALMN